MLSEKGDRGLTREQQRKLSLWASQQGQHLVAGKLGHINPINLRGGGGGGGGIKATLVT